MNNSHRYICPSCGKELRAPWQFVGKKVKCPGCGTPLQLSRDNELVHGAPAIKNPEAKFAQPMPPPLPHEVSNSSEHGRMSSMNSATRFHSRLSPDEFRVAGEELILIGTLLVAIGLTISVSFATLFIFGLLVLIVYQQAKRGQANLRKFGYRINEESHPHLANLVRLAAHRLDTQVPEFYVTRDSGIDAFATGPDRDASICLSAGICSALTSDELLFVIGHEISHIKCGHCRYLVFTNASQRGQTNPIASLFADLLFKYWRRRSELTCDRGGLLASRDLTAAVNALAKVEGFSGSTVSLFIHHAVQTSRQADDLESSHPETANRIRALWEYSRSSEYRRLASRLA